MERKLTPSAAVERTVTGRAGNPPGNGPFLHVTLQVSGEIIASASYETYQCPGCHACGKAISVMVAGKRLAQAAEITRPMVVEFVGPLAKHRQICYGLALLALDDALGQLGRT
jgi:NifU-like protein involved in Fe-S cluster formation